MMKAWMGAGSSLRAAADRQAYATHEFQSKLLEKREALEPGVYALARAMLNIAYREKKAPSKFGASADVVAAVREAIKHFKPEVSDTDLDHYVERALSMAQSPELRPVKGVNAPADSRGLSIPDAGPGIG
jgi:hypothetical protein